MLLKGALHTHSTCSDGVLSIPEVVQAYAELGFDFLALTDHDSLYKPDCYERGLAGVQTELIVFRGLELTVFEKGYVHVNRIEGDSETLHIFNHPAKLDLPLERAIERIEAVAATLPLDAVEVTSDGFYTPEYDTARIRWPKVATDDSHTLLGCGRAWIELEARREKDAILQAVRAGAFWNCFA